MNKSLRNGNKFTTTYKSIFPFRNETYVLCVSPLYHLYPCRSWPGPFLAAKSDWLLDTRPTSSYGCRLPSWLSRAVNHIWSRFRTYNYQPKPSDSNTTYFHVLLVSSSLFWCLMWILLLHYPSTETMQIEIKLVCSILPSAGFRIT